MSYRIERWFNWFQHTCLTCLDKNMQALPLFGVAEIILKAMLAVKITDENYSPMCIKDVV